MNLAPLEQALAMRFPDAGVRQRAALDALLTHGFPDRHVERWKYTRSAPYADYALRALAAQQPGNALDNTLTERLAQWQQQFAASYIIVIVNGQMNTAHTCLPSGVTMTPAIADRAAFKATPDDALALLNDALPTTQLTLSVADNTKTDAPLHIVHLSHAQNALAQVRIDVDLQPNSQLTIVEHILPADCKEPMHSTVATAQLAQGATLAWYRLQQAGGDALVATRLDAVLANDAVLDTLTLDVGGKLVRNDLNVVLAEAGASVNMRGVYLINGQQHVDNHTHVDHAAKDTTSNEDYRGVLRDHSRAVFNGKVYVHEGADGTDAAQSNKNLLLSDHAEIDTKPELEIYADDVKCAHGATVGQLDDASLFYLRSRGIDSDTATQLLTFAFCREVIRDIADLPVKTAAERLVANEIPDFTALDLAS